VPISNMQTNESVKTNVASALDLRVKFSAALI
jgi:hypothetical protein